MFNLTNKTMYVGDKRVYGAWLGDKLIHGHELLEYPKPPTEYSERYLSWARFFGAGEEEKYFSSTANSAVDTFRLPSDYTLHPYGLKINDNTSSVFFSRLTWTHGRSMEVTFRVDQDRADTISPGSSSTLINFRSGHYGGGLVRIFKDNDGNLSIGTAETSTRDQTTRPLELGKTYTVFLMFSSYLQNGYYIPTLNIYFNGVWLVDFEGSARSGEPDAGDVSVVGLVTIYDMKYYYLGSNAARTNYDGIKNIRFLGPEDMDNLITPEPDIVIPELPTDFGTSNLTWAKFFGRGEEETYHGSGNITLEGDAKQESNGLHLNGGGATFFNHEFLGGTGCNCFTIENNFDHLEPGESENILYLQNGSHFGATSYYKAEKGTDGQVYLFGAPAPETDFVHVFISYDYYISGSSYRHIFELWVNGIRIISKYATQSRQYYLRRIDLMGDLVVYDMKRYSRPKNYATTNYNSIKDLTLVRTDQL